MSVFIPLWQTGSCYKLPKPFDAFYWADGYRSSSLFPFQCAKNVCKCVLYCTILSTHVHKYMSPETQIHTHMCTDTQIHSYPSLKALNQRKAAFSSFSSFLVINIAAQYIIYDFMNTKLCLKNICYLIQDSDPFIDPSLSPISTSTSLQDMLSVEFCVADKRKPNTRL